MTLSERPQHTAPCPLLALYMESPNGWPGLPVAQYGNLVSRPLMALSLHATWSTVWEIPKGPVWPLVALSARPRYAARRPHRHCIEIPKRAFLTSLWHCIAISGTTVWASYSTGGGGGGLTQGNLTS